MNRWELLRPRGEPRVYFDSALHVFSVCDPGQVSVWKITRAMLIGGLSDLEAGAILDYLGASLESQEVQVGQGTCLCGACFKPGTAN